MNPKLKASVDSDFAGKGHSHFLSCVPASGVVRGVRGLLLREPHLIRSTVQLMPCLTDLKHALDLIPQQGS